MIRTLRPLDLLEPPLWRGTRLLEHAVTLERLGRAPEVCAFSSLARERVLSSWGPPVWVAGEGRRIVAIAQGCPRSGPRSWEMRHLWADEAGEETVAELLDQTALSAAESGARRVFLRLCSSSALVPVASQAGYVATWDETLYEATRSVPSSSDAPEVLGVRKRCLEDDMALFRLFCSSAPPEVRSAQGLTLEEWKDSTEPVRHGGAEWVCVAPTKAVTGMLQIKRVGRRACASVLAAPGALEPLLVRASARFSGTTFVLVGEYQPGVRREMESLAFVPRERFTVLVKSVAAPVREVALAPASI